MALTLVPKLTPYARESILAEAAFAGGLYRLTHAFGPEVPSRPEICYVAHQALEHLLSRGGIIGEVSSQLISEAKVSAGSSLFREGGTIERRPVPRTERGEGLYFSTLRGIVYAAHHGVSLDEGDMLTGPVMLGGTSLFSRMSGEEMLAWILWECGMPVEPEIYLKEERLPEIRSALESPLPPVALPTGFRGLRVALTRGGQLQKYLDAVSEEKVTPARRVQLRRGILEIARSHSDWFDVDEIRKLVKGLEGRDIFKIFLLAELAIAGNPIAQKAIQKRNLAEGAGVLGRVVGHAGYLGTVNVGFLVHGRGNEKYPLLWLLMKGGSGEALQIAMGNYLAAGHFHQFLTEGGDPEKGEAALRIIELSLPEAAGFRLRSDLSLRRCLPAIVRELEAFLGKGWSTRIRDRARHLLETGDFRGVIQVSLDEGVPKPEMTVALERLRDTYRNSSVSNCG